jgi:hypothetical protein
MKERRANQAPSTDRRADYPWFPPWVGQRPWHMRHRFSVALFGSRRYSLGQVRVSGGAAMRNPLLSGDPSSGQAAGPAVVRARSGSGRLRRRSGPLLLLAALSLSALLVVGCTDTSGCAACGREKCNNMMLTLVREDGTRQEACCARCGAQLMASGPRVTAVGVRAYDTSESLDATRAIFVEGADVHPCRGLVDRPATDERGCCLSLVYDRCLPSLVAFGDAEAARAFMARHGGLVTRWAAIAGASSPR